MIIDVCLYNGEDHLFDLRHRIMSPVVDLFIVIEGTHTFQGATKDVTFDSSKYPKSEHLIYTAPRQFHGNPWKMETAHRDAAYEVVLGRAERASDTVVLGDVDEIVKPEILTRYRRSEGLTLNPRVWVMELYFSYYYANLRTPGGCQCNRMATMSLLKSIGSMQALRKAQGVVIENAGWHFSYMMTTDEIRRKLRSFAHSEYSGDQWSSTDAISAAVRDKRDLFNRPDMTWIPVPIDNTFPPELQAWSEQYKGYILDV